MMAMEMYLSHLLGKHSAETFVLVRDDAKVENNRRSTFKSSTKQRSTSPWKPLSKSKAPTLPARSTSTEDLSALQKPGGHKNQASVVSGNPSSDENHFFSGEEDFPEEETRLNPFNGILNDLGSKFPEQEDCIAVSSSPKSPLRKRTSSLDDSVLLSRSPILLCPAATRSSSPIDRYLRSSTTNNTVMAGQHPTMRRRSSDCGGLSMSHMERLNLYGLISIVDDPEKSKNNRYNPRTEAPPIKPFRKESNDDLSHPSNKKGNREHLFETLDNVILNSTWDKIDPRLEVTDRPHSADVTGLSV